MAEAGVLSPVDSTECVFIAHRSRWCHISMAEVGVHSPSSILASLYVVDGVLSRSLSFLHMMRWSRPDVLNSIRELSKHMTAATQTHLKAMYRAMTYCVHTKDRGLTLKPNRTWSRSPNHEFVIKGQADASYASCPNTMRSTGGQTTLLEGAPVVMRSKMQKVVALSVTEAELMSGTECAQDICYTQCGLLSPWG
jgi:hypothetical protein